MKTTLILFLLTLTVAGFAQTQRPDPRSRVIANLNQVESLYLSRLSGKELQDAVRLLNETRAIIAGLPVEQPPSGPAGNSNRISDEGLQALVDAVKKESFDRYRTKLVVSSLGANGKILLTQVRALLQFFDSDDGKRDMLIAIHDNVLDPVNIAIVVPFFTFDSYRDQVLKAYKSQ